MMPFIPYEVAREIYHKRMEKELYESIGNNSSLKEYVDAMYRRERYLSLFIGIEIALFMLAIFVFVIYPELELQLMI